MKLPPGGYRLEERPSEISGFGAAWLATAPDGSTITQVGGGSGPNAGKRNQRLAAEQCWNHFGHAAEPLLEASKAAAGAIQDEIDSYAGEEAPHPVVEGHAATLKALRAAIARVEGR